MINQNDFLTLTGLEWGLAWDSEWISGVDDEFVSFIAENHSTLESSRMRCALTLFAAYNSAHARDVANEYVNDDRGEIRDAARNVFETHHKQNWIAVHPSTDWKSNASFESPLLTKRQRQRQRKHGQAFARGEER